MMPVLLQAEQRPRGSTAGRPGSASISSRSEGQARSPDGELAGADHRLDPFGDLVKALSAAARHR